MPYRKTASRFLLPRLAESILQLWRVRHRETRAVQIESPMPMPQRHVHFVIHSDLLPHAPAQSPESFQRQPRAGRAIRPGREGSTGPLTHVSARLVPIHHLTDKELNRLCRSQRPIPPAVTVLGKQIFDGLSIQNRVDLQRLLLDPLQRISNTGHPWPPVGW